ncbi:MAG: hypothetical protein WA484_04805 [Solirubrobacteraceae bacterium]
MKGLASGFENTVTVDLILSMRKTALSGRSRALEPPEGATAIVIEDVLAGDSCSTLSHVYVDVIRHYLGRGWELSKLDIGGIGVALRELGYALTGRL